MRNLTRLFIATMLLMAFTIMAKAQQAPAGQAGQGGQRGGGGGPAMALTTTAWPDGGAIPAKYSVVTQPPVTPPLSWTNVPAGAQAFVLLMHDPDLAARRTTDDGLAWLLVNIPGTVTSLPEGIAGGDKLADGTMQFSSLGNTYNPPGAPPTGPPHHYTFELFALDSRLDITPGPTPQETRAAVMKAMNGHIVGKAVYVGLFRRPAQ